jgi:transposase
MAQISTIGLDLAKRLFQVHGIAADGTVVIRRQLRRSEMLKFFGAPRKQDVLPSQTRAALQTIVTQLQAIDHEIGRLEETNLSLPVKIYRTSAAGRIQATPRGAGAERQKMWLFKQPDMREPPASEPEEPELNGLDFPLEARIRGACMSGPNGRFRYGEPR